MHLLRRGYRARGWLSDFVGATLVVALSMLARVSTGYGGGWSPTRDPTNMDKGAHKGRPYRDDLLVWLVDSTSASVRVVMSCLDRLAPMEQVPLGPAIAESYDSHTSH